MSNAKILYDALCIRYPNGLKPISDLSKNTDGVPGGKKYIECNHVAFNYDLVTNCSANDRKEKSPDALFLDGQTLHFVEFKEGGAKRIEIRQKIHEGLVTLFQFAVRNGVLTREQFLSLDFHYTVVKRGQSNPMVSALDLAIDSYGLKNLEGFLLKKTDVRCAPQKILEYLHRITGQAIRSIDYYCPDGNLTTLTV